ncbi:hypothetical protein ES332_A01G086800v1 [Gossypium tomentosum]|uniref:Uncharacterized protein n=1 Tax=Gossypium tomentosum TaxID=34277 RepID=A0A5D2RQW0_GOSTO|nr:hypothetical protein ES332_A01G086800v1 [Gossypium tomentosum]
MKLNPILKFTQTQTKPSTKAHNFNFQQKKKRNLSLRATAAPPRAHHLRFVPRLDSSAPSHYLLQSLQGEQKRNESSSHNRGRNTTEKRM